MSGSGGAPASAGDGGDVDREGRTGEEGGDGGECMCRQINSTGRMKWPRRGERSRALGLCLDSGRAGTPAVHRGSTGWSGSDSAGSRAAGAGEEGRERTGGARREGGAWPASGSRRRRGRKRQRGTGGCSPGSRSV